MIEFKIAVLMVLPCRPREYEEACISAVQKIFGNNVMPNRGNVLPFSISFFPVNKPNQCRGIEMNEYFVSEEFRFNLESKMRPVFIKHHDLLMEVEKEVYFNKQKIEIKVAKSQANEEN
jgi:hypothetical protein